MPRYYIPLTWRGRPILFLNAHRGLIGMLPGGVVDILVTARAWLYEAFSKRGGGFKSVLQKAGAAGPDARRGASAEADAAKMPDSEASASNG